MKTRMTTPRLFVALLFVATVSVSNVHATTYTVQNTGDGAATPANCPGSGCRLRDAMAKVVDNDVIDFSVTTPACRTTADRMLKHRKSDRRRDAIGQLLVHLGHVCPFQIVTPKRFTMAAATR